MLSISQDGTTYVRIDESELSHYSFVFLRFSFPLSDGPRSSVFLRTLRFEENPS